LSVAICKLSREKRSSLCATALTRPDFGYCTAQKRYFGYKLHLVCDENAAVYSYDVTPVSIHDVTDLKRRKKTQSEQLQIDWQKRLFFC
jgi:hypothetical protein